MDLRKTVRGNFVVRKPVHDVIGCADSRNPSRAEELRGVKNVSEMISFKDRGERGVVTRLTESESTGRAQNAMQKNRLPDRQFDRCKTSLAVRVFRGGELSVMESRRNGDRKLL